MEKKILLQFPLCSPDNLICARLMTSAVCSLMKLDIGVAEDIKVCVNEACLIMFGEKYRTINISFYMEDGLTINVCGEGTCEGSNFIDEKSKELGLILLNSIMDNVEYNSNSGIVSSITLIKRINN